MTQHPTHADRLAAVAARADDQVTPEDMPSPAPDAVCVCGHPRSEHNHVDDMTGCGFIYAVDGGDGLCGCERFEARFVPAHDVPAHDTPKAAILLKPDATYTGNTRVTMEVFKQPSPAHDTPTAKLRERIAVLERDLNDSTAQLELDNHECVTLRERVAALERELAEAKSESLKDTDRRVAAEHAFATDAANADKYYKLFRLSNAAKRAARAEAADLRAQLADRNLAWHTLVDGYAGAMADLAAAKEFISAYDAWVKDESAVWGAPFGELVLAREKLQPEAPRPTTEAKP